MSRKLIIVNVLCWQKYFSFSNTLCTKLTFRILEFKQSVKVKLSKRGKGWGEVKVKMLAIISKE